MADTKLTALTALAETPASDDIIPIVDISDTTDAASGTTKGVTRANLVGGLAASSHTHDYVPTSYLDTDATFTANSDTKVATQKATKSFVEAQIAAAGGYTDEMAQDAVGGMVTGNTESGITVEYDDANAKLNFTVASQTDNNFTTTLKNKLDGIEASANNYTHPATHSADIITDGTTNKAYTATEQTKLAGIATGAEVNVQSDWNQATDTADDYIKNKPALGDAAAKNTGTTTGTVAAGDHTHTGIYEAANANIQSHISSTSNPHSTTADQVLPSQTENSGKVLGTNGTTASWVEQSGGIEGSGVAKITVGTTEPTSPSAGDLWIDTN